MLVILLSGVEFLAWLSVTDIIPVQGCSTFTNNLLKRNAALTSRLASAQVLHTVAVDVARLRNMFSETEDAWQAIIDNCLENHDSVCEWNQDAACALCHTCSQYASSYREHHVAVSKKAFTEFLAMRLKACASHAWLSPILHESYGWREFSLQDMDSYHRNIFFDTLLRKIHASLCIRLASI